MTGSEILQTAIEQWARTQPDKVCLVETSTGQSLTYRQLLDAVGIARERWHEQPQTIAAALSGSIVDAVVWLAALTGGQRLVPLSPDVTTAEYANILARYQPDEILYEQANPAFTAGVSVETLAASLSRPRQEVSRPLPEAREGSVILSTSGSTGAPKGVLLTATQIVAAAEHIQGSHHLTAADRVLTPLPFSHVNAPVVSLVTSILAGGSVVIAPRHSTSQFWQWVETYRPTWISIVPTIVAMLLTTKRPAFLDENTVRFVRTASAPLARADLLDFEAKFGLPVVETYGLSEAAATVAANPVPPEIHKPGSVGKPIGVEMRICDRRGRTLPAGKTGEVQVRGRNVIDSYMHGVGQDSFRDGWLRTGDMGYFDPDGYLFLTGRIKDIIIRGGENIMPREIEEALLTSPLVRETVVVGQPHAVYGEIAAAFVVLDDTRPAGLETVQAHAAERLSRGKRPEAWYVVRELPRTASGKIDKVRLRRELAAQAGQAA